MKFDTTAKTRLTTKGAIFEYLLESTSIHAVNVTLKPEMKHRFCITKLHYWIALPV